MKKLLSLFVPLMALFLTLLPQTAKAQYTGSANGHDWVILWEGGPRWATVNIGASTNTEAGNYYMWGGTTANPASCTWANYPYKGSSSSTNPYTKYGYAKDGNLVLEEGDDAAKQAWGKGWRTPTKAELDDLLVYCNTSPIFITQNVLQGLQISSKTTGQTILLPAVGYKYQSNSSASQYGYRGEYMSSTSTTSPSTSTKDRDCYRFVWYTTSASNNTYEKGYSGSPRTDLAARYNGYPIRAIYEPSEEYDVTVQADNTGYGSVGGTTSMEDVVEGSAITINGNTLTLDGKTATATPIAADANYIYYFTGWTSGGNAVEDGTSLAGDMTITANFARKSSNCTITIATPAGYGNITVSDGINTYAVGQSHTFNRYTDSGKVLTVTATPASGCVFVSWLGDLTQTGTNPYTATYTISTTTPDNITIGATFALTHTVTFKDYDGTNLAEPFALQEGLTPVYSGSEPSRLGYFFTGWTDNNSVFTAKDASLPALTGDVVYTATYIKEPDYFTITNKKNSPTIVAMKRNNTSSPQPKLYVRIFNSDGTINTTWNEDPIIVNTGTSYDKTLGTIPAGGWMQIYGVENNNTISHATNDNYFTYFRFTTSNSNVELSGNILSLVACSSDRKTINNSYSLPNRCFNHLFYNCTAITSAEDLELPSTTVSQYGYYHMFDGCTGLTKAPALPAATLQNYGYAYMFNGCTSLTDLSSLNLPATTVSQYGYYYMFSGCTGVTKVPALPATTLQNYCYAYMFNGCTSLTDLSSLNLPATTISQYGYSHMFDGCTGLTKAPALPATTLQSNGYAYMFNGCTSLTTVPAISANSVATCGCYYMFSGCTSLANFTNYSLPATTLGDQCYSYMFSGCTALSDLSSLNLPATTLQTNCYKYMFNGCTGLTRLPALSATALRASCYYGMFAGCTSLIDLSSFSLPATNFSSNSSVYAYMFQNCTGLTKAPALPATTLSSYCYQYMFSGCSKLEEAPSLPATTLATYCYYYMFQNCTSLKKAPTLPASTMQNYCYQYMFDGCSALNTIRTYHETFNTTYFTNWVRNVNNVGVFYCSPKLSRSTYSANYIPKTSTYKWTVYSYNVTFNPVECTWKDATNSSKQFTWQTDVEDVTKFLTDESGLGATFYTDAACTSETSVSAITTALATQRESSAATTKKYYVKKAPTLQSLTWDVNGGSALTGDYTHGEIYSGTAVTAPADPTRDGFAFCGWDAGNDGVADEVVTIMPGNDLTYTAIWRQLFTITFKDAENNTLQSGGVAEGSVPVFSGDIPVKASADPDHVYNFTGWTDGNANFTANGTPLPAVTGNTVYTATYAYEMNYLTFTNTHASQTLTVQLKRGSNPPTNVTLNYRVISANGIVGAWQTLTTVNNTNTYTVGEIPAGARMQLYGSNPSGFAQSTMNYWKFYFGTTGSAVLSGDLMSIFSGTVSSFDRSQTLPSYAFYGLFYENSAYNPSIVSAKDLKLSATNLGQYCYRNMFYGCSNMTDAPQLSATTLAAYCYQNMFCYCSSLTTAPTLPATTLADYCYYSMFSYCTSLTTAPQLSVTTLTEGCYQSMFQGCTALVNVQNLPGTNLPKNCYSEMFSGCTALTTAPEIMAAEDAVPGIAACNSMFNGCTALTKAPSVLKPRTITVNQAYYNMFLNCTSLQRGPDVWATSITSGKTALYGLYQNASNVRHIRVHFTAWGASSFCSQWVYGVSPTGEFYCPPELPRTYSSTSYWNQAPRSTQDPWTIYSYDVTFVPVGGKWADGTATEKQFTWRTDKSDIDNFIAAQVDEDENNLIQGWFLNAACTDATTEEAVKADLSVQQTNTTKYVYVRLNGTSVNLTWYFNGGTTSSTEAEYSSGEMNEGDPITAPANPTLAGFEFVGWDAGDDGIADEVAINMPSSDLTYTAIWRQIYTITYEGLNGATNTNPTSYTVATATITLENPGTRTGYTFTGWTMGGAPVTQIVTGSTGDKTITAVWTANTHNVNWVTDGNALTGTYTTGTTAYGTTIIAPNTPTKNATAQYTYTFNGWEPALDATMPDNDVTYTATWTETKRQYTLTWDVNGGNALTGTYTNGTIAWGTDIVKPANPTRTDYTFGGWDANNDGKADEVAETMPTTSLTYKAIWVAELPNITLCENCENDHYNTFKSDYDGETVNVTYPRQFAANRWSTMCLPFSIELPEMIVQKMYGRVYEFKYATGNANTNSGVNLYFSNAKKIEAGKCYIVNANDALAAKTSFVFSGVTIDLTKDNGADLSSPETPEASMAAYNALPGYKSEGTIELVGTLRNGTLQGSATGNRYMGLKDNKIYYPNISQGSTIWAYRGIFRSKETLNIEKMRIIVDGEDRGEIIIDADGDVRAPSDAPSRKFIRDGVLYIEREGVIYDAQGKRVEGSF